MFPSFIDYSALAVPLSGSGCPLLFENLLQLPYFFVNLAFQVLGLPVCFQVRIVREVAGSLFDHQEHWAERRRELDRSPFE